MRRPRESREGFALVAVLLVLLALLVLLVPYLAGITRADRQSGLTASRGAARLALDDAARHARAVLDATHPAVDPTPYFDSAAELAVDADLPRDFLDPHDPSGVMWDLDAVDLSGRIDLETASPGVLANLLGRSTWLSRGVAEDDAELPAAGAFAFPEAGFLWVAGERVFHRSREGGAFGGVERGLFAPDAAAGACAPGAAAPHPAGTPVYGLAAFALPLWRIAGEEPELRAPGSERLAEVFAAAPDGPLDAPRLSALAAATTSHGAAGAGPRWQRAVRVRSSVQSGVDCALLVDEWGFFNPGTTVRIEDGASAELALVKSVTAGRVELTDVLANDYDGDRAVVRALARRPVNLNTAPPEVLRALFLGLKQARVNSRITEREAGLLVEVVAASRPFEGFRDFAERVVLPAAGIAPLPDDAPVRPALWDAVGEDGFLDRADAEALYRNGLNANDAALELSTMPFSFTSRGGFELALRSSANAKSGLERAALRRDQAEVVVPQTELLALWSRQEDLDLALRLGRDAPLWATGPEPTGRHREGGTPPSRFAAHLGLSADGAEDQSRTFASREDEGWAQLQPSRVEEVATRGHARGFEHFDDEEGDLEGRDLDRSGPFRLAPDDPRVQWTDGADGLLHPLSFALWTRPRAVGDGDLLLDVGGPFTEADRVSLAVEDGEVVLSVLDAGGDHPETELVERTEVRLPLERLPLDTWTHLAADVRGSRPDQVELLVDGMARGETGGLTRLTSPVSEVDTLLRVESTAGFGEPGERCVLVVGEELIEARILGVDRFSALRQVSGVGAGTGGRLARERWLLSPDGLTATPDGAAAVRTYDAGTPVALYGYSMPLLSPVLPGEARLAAPLGAFAAAVVRSVQGGDAADGDRIVVNDRLGMPREAGFGLESGFLSKATGLVLGRADEPEGNDETFMSAFDPRGGYALLVQRRILFANGELTVNGTTMGGVELLRYTGVAGRTLLFGARGVTADIELQNATLDGDRFGTRAFIHEFSPLVTDGSKLNGGLEHQVFVVPISLSVPNVAPFNDQFLQPTATESQYAQITRTDGETHLTEWVCYDEIAPPRGGVPAQLVRDAPHAVEELWNVLTRGERIQTSFTELPPGVGGPPTGGTGGPTGVPSGGGLPSGGGAAQSVLAPGAPAPPALPAAPAQDGAVPGAAVDEIAWQWRSELGTEEGLEHTLSRAAGSALGFRGVLGTFSHAHPAGTLVLPVFRAYGRGIDAAAPSRGDHVWLLDETAAGPGWPVVVHNAHVPDVRRRVYEWSSTGLGADAAQAGTRTVVVDEFNGTFQNWQTLFALRRTAPVLVPPSLAITTPSLVALDTREVARISKFPSGELPRLADAVAVGGRFRGGGDLPDAVVDELEFGSTEFAEERGTGATARGAAMLLSLPVGEIDLELEVYPQEMRVPQGVVGTSGVDILLELPEDGGLLRIGEEIVAYRSRDAQLGVIELAADGRGLLGTEPQAHAAREPVHFLSHLVATTLTSSLPAGAADLPLAGLRGFPTEGTLLVGEELLHYTRRSPADAGGGVAMPRASSEPGARDAEGGGLFRGRYGTAAGPHPEGTAVVLFPFRYWDRFAERADAPELAYFGFDASQEDAFWRTTFFEEREALHPGVRLGLLVRADEDVPWDAVPRAPGAESQGGRGLWLFDGEEDGRLPLGAQSDRLELRVFARYEPGALDLVDGLAHGWKTTPRLTRVGAEYLAPRTVLAREER